MQPVTHLQVTPPAGTPFECPLTGEFLVIGRSEDADLTLADRYLSRRHARIFRRDGRLLIEDLGSQNGTFVNETAVSEPVELRAGDVIRISSCLLRVEGVPAGGEARDPGRRTSETVLLRSARDMLTAPPEVPADESQDRETLSRRADRLRLLNEVHQALAQKVGREGLLELILDRIFDHLGPEEAVIYLGRTRNELTPAAARSRNGSGTVPFFSRSLAEEVTDRGLAALVVDARTDERFAASESILVSGVRSIAAAPLLDPDGVQGMITVASRLHVRQFEEDDLELLVSLASVAALHLRNLALTEEAVERRRLAQELALARRIQVGLLPSALPEVPGWELHGASAPSQEVSGDYYLIDRFDGGRCVVMVVDVSGKGIAAALLTASVEALAAGFLEVGHSPEEVCDRVCRGLLARTPPEKYATAFVAALDPAAGTFRYANAGHNPGLVIRAGGSVERLEATGPPLGLLPGSERRGVDVELAPGDLLLVYTDGITEATEPAGAEYGLERLEHTCRELRDRPLPEIATALEEDLARFTRGTPFADDRTLVLARRTAGA